MRDGFEIMEDMICWLFGAYSPHELDYMCALICTIVTVCFIALFQWWDEKEYFGKKGE